MNYNVVLTTVVQQCDSVIYPSVHILFFIFFSIMVYHRILNIVPCDHLIFLFDFNFSTGSFRKEYCYQLERICYNFRKQLRNVHSGLEQVEAAALPGMPPGNFSSTGKGCCPSTPSERHVAWKPQERGNQAGKSQSMRCWGPSSYCLLASRCP